MRYPACAKLEIIHLVEQSHLPVRRASAAIDFQGAVASLVLLQNATERKPEPFCGVRPWDHPVGQVDLDLPFAGEVPGLVGAEE
jgi:hypothetical protein